jgi:hypothetical protein
VQRLRELGWREGLNLSIEYRWAEGRFERLADFADEFVFIRTRCILKPMLGKEVSQCTLAIWGELASTLAPRLRLVRNWRTVEPRDELRPGRIPAGSRHYRSGGHRHDSCRQEGDGYHSDCVPDRGGTRLPTSWLIASHVQAAM